MPKTFDITMAGQRLVLRADRSLWWPAQKILFIADLHAGKTEHFQRAGSAVPSGSLQADLARLQAAIAGLRPQRVIVLGDLFHSDINTEWAAVTNWIRSQTCSVELVRGNHDRFINDETFQDGDLIVHEEGLKTRPFTLRHHPTNNDDYVLCGHLHPVHTFHGLAKDRLRLACFVATDRQIILPAFGSFTGGLAVSQADGRLIATAPDFQSLIV